MSYGTPIAKVYLVARSDEEDEMKGKRTTAVRAEATARGDLERALYDLVELRAHGRADEVRDAERRVSRLYRDHERALAALKRAS